MPRSADDELAALRERLWLELQRATEDRAHGWRTPVLATRDGDEVDARTLILREVDAAAQVLTCYTDARSPKVAQIAVHPQGKLVAWCPALQWQLRLTLRLQAELDGLAVSSRWTRLALRPQAQDYLSPLPPGAPLPTPVAPPRAGRGHFALLRAEVLAIDWLGLRADGHRRARFDADGARWITP